MADGSRAIYVRMPDRVAKKLDDAAKRLGVSKRDVLTTLVNKHLEVVGDDLFVRVKPGRSGAPPGAGSEVLSLQQAADLLRVSEADVLDLVQSGVLPARQVGGHWRMSRQAVLRWLGGGGDSAERPA